MRMTARVAVKEVSQKEDYPLKPNGETDYRSKKISFFESELRILDNNLGIRGTITVREKLEFGVLHTIIIDTDQGLQVAVAEGDTDNVLPFDTQNV